MDYNKPLDLLHMAQETKWVDKVNMARVDGHLCSWATGFHPRNLSCRLDGGFLNGSYSVGQKLVFDDGTTWLLRLPRASRVSPEYADEKIAMEVEALHVIREKTSLPVPEVYAWGLARENRLGLGPFILINFINGIGLGEVFGGGSSRLIREDIPDADIEFLYRQMAHFMLQFYRIDFSQIGSLTTLQTKFPAPGHPLTWKVHEILRVGGVDTLVCGDRANGFSTTRDYSDARSRYASLKILESLIPELTHPTYDRGPFKLICDDFGLGSVIVRSKDDLTITGVVDMEWVYAGPAQLFGSAPWWLLMDRPLNEEWDFDEDDAPEATDRYFKYLEIFIRVLSDEEGKMTGNGRKELTELVKRSKDS
ncbi:phosphotransferase enzyme family protein [Aspergillus flavus]|uniref:Phosphotransferase enzyme family protein n=1 Tax=Aspergillus flavus TaxID=5059 RepID=A0AB74CQK1_ASPFL|nr:phosphotransferase enzyme family protein [Aspergillus flavus]